MTGSSSGLTWSRVLMLKREDVRAAAYKCCNELVEDKEGVSLLELIAVALAARHGDPIAPCIACGATHQEP